MNVTVKLEDAKWHVVSLFLEHNHSLVSSPSLARFFMSQRHMNEALGDTAYWFDNRFQQCAGSRQKWKTCRAADLHSRVDEGAINCGT